MKPEVAPADRIAGHGVYFCARVRMRTAPDTASCAICKARITSLSIELQSNDYLPMIEKTSAGARE
jgi:hypothetical protein